MNTPSKNPLYLFQDLTFSLPCLTYSSTLTIETIPSKRRWVSTELESITAHKITLFKLICYCLFLSDSEVTLEHSSFWEAYSHSAGQGPEDPLPCLEEPVVWPYHEPDKSIHTLISCLFKNFLKTLPSTSRFFKWSFRFRSFQVHLYRSHEYDDKYALNPVLEQ
jgi:hypothetical protein